MEFDRYAKELDDLMVDLDGAETERAWLGDAGTRRNASEFQRRGFSIFPIPQEYLSGIEAFFDQKLQYAFDAEDCAADAWPARVSAEDAARLNRTHLYFRPPSEAAQQELRAFLDSISSNLEDELASPFAVFNVRAVAALKAESFGPTAWHYDGSARFIRKILIYPQQLNAANGTIELFDRSGGNQAIQSEQPTAILYDTSILLHRGRPSTVGEDPRPMLEITIVPAVKTSTELRFRGQNARCPRIDPNTLQEGRQALYVSLRKLVDQGAFRKNKPKKTNRKRFHKFLRRNFPWLPDFETREPTPGNAAGKVNIGGGPGFNYLGWLNFDSVDLGSVGAHIDFSPETILPVASGTVGTVYTSHCLEHLDDATVDRLLEETRRIIADDGALVIKIPDFERVLDCVEGGDSAFFERQWNIESITPTWPSKGVEDTIAARASFVFAGYWNTAFGNPFSAPRDRAPNAYHGPAPLPEEEHRAALALKDPRAIAEALTKAIAEQSDFAGYNHQNAWSRTQLANLVERHGFNIVSNADQNIRKHFKSIPGIDQMHRISQYMWARP